MYLSICIPSYNRLNHLKEMVTSVLMASSLDFELVIVDNGSAFNVLEEFQDCRDKRLRIIKRSQLISGPTNARLVLDEAQGEYAMLCLDKDFIIGAALDTFIEKLKKTNNVACGYCLLNSNDKNAEFVYSEDLINNIYRCGHPSGTFFKTELIREDSKELELASETSIYYNNPFLIDLTFAKTLCSGNQAVYTGELIKTETLEEAANKVSNSYSSNRDNIYFRPNNKIKQFWIFVTHMDKLPISERDKKKILKRIIRNTLYDVSIGYKRIMSNDLLCKHHGLNTEVITKKDMLQNITRFFKNFDLDNLSPAIRDNLGYILLTEKARIITRMLIGG